MELINAERVKNGLAPLVLNQDLIDAAEKNVTYMELNNIFDHCYTVDGVLSSPQSRADAEGYIGGVGENLAAAKTADKVFEGWMSSPPHKAAILLPHIKDIGVGYYHAVGGYDTAVAEFGVPNGPPWHTC